MRYLHLSKLKLETSLLHGRYLPFPSDDVWASSTNRLKIIFQKTTDGPLSNSSVSCKLSIVLHDYVMIILLLLSTSSCSFTDNINYNNCRTRFEENDGKDRMNESRNSVKYWRHFKNNKETFERRIRA